jgi:hypothetical protein
MVPKDADIICANHPVIVTAERQLVINSLAEMGKNARIHAQKATIEYENTSGTRFYNHRHYTDCGNWDVAWPLRGCRGDPGRWVEIDGCGQWQVV